MGIIAETCIKCTKKEDDVKVMLKANSRTTKMIIKDKYCQGEIETVTYEDKEVKEVPKKKNANNKKLLKPSIFLYTNQFYLNPKDSYQIDEDINENLKVVHLLSSVKNRRFMKIIDGGEDFNNKEKKTSFLQKVKDLQLLDHPNISKIYEVYIYDNKYFLIEDYHGENNIAERIKNNGTPEESTVKAIMNQIFNTITYLHENDIFDINLKLENIILIEKTIKSNKKIIKSKKTKELSNQDNFKKKIETKLSILGYLKDFYSNSELDEIKYYAPEIIEQIEQNNLTKKNNIPTEDDNDDDKKDEWTLGVIMHYLITGEFPFDGSTKEDIFNKIKNEDIDFSSSKYDSFSPEGKDFLSKLLVKDPKKRMKYTESFEHPFLTGEIKKKESDSDEAYAESLKNLLNIKKPKSKFHEVIIAYLCYNFIDKAEEKKLSDLFKYIDQDHNNVISFDDIKNAFNKINIEYTEEHIKNIFYVFDYDKNSYIQYQEFLRVLCNKKDLFKEENLKSVFNVVDSDKSNAITGYDLNKFIFHDENDINTVEKEFIEPLGMNVDDKITFKQFCEIMREDKSFDEINKDNNNQENDDNNDDNNDNNKDNNDNNKDNNDNNLNNNNNINNNNIKSKIKKIKNLKNLMAGENK